MTISINLMEMQNMYQYYMRITISPYLGLLIINIEIRSFCLFKYLKRNKYTACHLLCFCLLYLLIFIFTGTIFSLTGTGSNNVTTGTSSNTTNKPPLRRVPTDYDLPPVPVPRKQQAENV